MTSVCQRSGEAIDSQRMGHDCDRALARMLADSLKLKANADFHNVNYIVPAGATYPLTFIEEVLRDPRITNGYYAQ